VTGSRVLVPVPPDKDSALRRLARIVVPAAADLVLLGDSNAAAWPADLLDAALAGLRVFNFGLPGDRIQNTLWRLDAISTGHLRPRYVLLVLGTNNLADGDAPDDIAAGLAAVIEASAGLWGAPEIILPAIARRVAGPLARSSERVLLNDRILAIARPGVHPVRADLVLDAIGAAAFEPDGIHVSRLGYERLTSELAVLIAHQLQSQSSA
jgi:lysophospholipase L1-like esterase